MNFTRLLTLVSSVVVVVLLSPTAVGDNTNCCTQLNIPSECHFLCGVGSQPFWTITRWKCTHKYFAKVATCKVNNKINYVKLFGQELTQSGGNKTLKVAKTSNSTSNSAGSCLKPSLREAHARFVQMILSSVLDDDFLGSLEEQKDLYFAQAKEVVEFACLSKTSLVLSNVWDPQFKEMLKNCPILKDTCLRVSVDDICQACKRKRHITRSFEFYYKLNDEMAKEFRIGCFCAEKALLYHRLCHYCTDELKEKCSEKLEEERAEGIDLSSADVVVERLCVEDDTWQNELFSEFEKLLNKADEWAVDGKEHRKMMSSVSRY